MLFLEEVGERPYRLRRMLTQLRLAGRLAQRRRRSCSASCRAATSRAARLTARDGVAEVFAGFPGPVLFGFPSGHTTTPLVSLPFGVRRARRRRPARPGLVLEEAAAELSDGARPLHRRLRHGHGDAGGHAQGARARRAGLRPRRLSADERVPRARGHPRLRRLPRRAHHGRISTSSSSATRSRAAIPSSRRSSIARSASRRCPRPFATHFLWQSRSIVIAGTHGKTTTTALTGWLLTAARPRPERARRRHRAQLRRQLPAGRRAATSSSRATSTTAPSSTRPPSS